MDAFEPIRQNAAALHDEVVSNGADPSSPLALVEAAAKYLLLEIAWVGRDDPVLKGAQALFDEQIGLICCASEGDEPTRACLVAHEIGHVRVHVGSAHCETGDINPSRSMEAAPVGLQRVEDYGARERRELQADVFAREFLFPRNTARKLYLDGHGASLIAKAQHLPLNLVRQQLYDALLLPPFEPEIERTVTKKSNSSQDRAAAHRDSPYLLEAGPGTGKTSTLINRVLSLLSDNVDPAAILVLTYSNRAAGELSERLSAAAPNAAPKIWIGTLHAFGLDIIRRYHEQLDLPADPPLFDRSDAIEVLEAILPTLPLVHYRNLWDPAMELREIVNAISCAKDELVDADGYELLAQQMLAGADGEKDQEEAKKALEVASIYKLYEQALRSRTAVDFGDLIMRPTRLLENDASVAETLRLRHRHVLVDEYQDVNRASARLLKALVGDGARFWAVGDARQSIYRFRGASSANMARFKLDYTSSKIDQLEVNYRSSQEIVEAYQAVAPRMSASVGMLPLDLTTDVGSTGIQPGLRTFDTPDEEIGGIAASVRELEDKGINLKNQAILCRTNSRLNDIAAGLEARGIPVLHLGSLFERDEIRDLLALLSLAVDRFGAGLVRVGAMPRYDIPLQDIYVVIQHCQSAPKDVVSRLASFADELPVSEDGKRGLRLLTKDLQELREDSSPWNALAIYLLDHTDTIATMVRDGSVRSRMKAVAIWQLLNFVRDQTYFGIGFPIQKLLNRVRTLVLLSEERDLRQIPPSALHMNAVRLMTVHGSKGLEFDAVHLPGLTVAGFPASYRGQRCPPPTGLVEGSGNVSGSDVAKLSHAAEEECLFFVALSRARRHLRIYNSRRQRSGDKRNPSPYLDWLRPSHLLEDATPPIVALPADAPPLQPIGVKWSDGWKITHPLATSYKKCARRFFYTHALRLKGTRKATPFNQTHDCLYEFMDWLAVARLEGAVDSAAAMSELDRIWAAGGPTTHAYAADYRGLADAIATSLLASTEGRLFHPVEELPVPCAGGNIVVVPDGLTTSPNGTPILCRIRTGYKRSKEYEEDIIYGLYHLAAQTRYGSVYIIEAIHLSDDVLEEVPVPSARVLGNRKQTGEKLVAGILAGLFPPDPDPITCPRCPHFFICAASGRGDLVQA